MVVMVFWFGFVVVTVGSGKYKEDDNAGNINNTNEYKYGWQILNAIIDFNRFVRCPPE